MKGVAALFLFVSFFALAETGLSAGNDDARELARAVWKGCGGEEWVNVQEVHFTFVEEVRGKDLFQAEHVWNVPGATDLVKWDGKSVTVNLLQPAKDKTARAAYARWVNDSNWLVAPLKLNDAPATLQWNGNRQVDGHPYQTLRLRYKQSGGSGAGAIVYIDPRSMRVSYWDSFSKDGSVIHSTWENYKTFSGIILATEHRSAGKTIRLTNVQVTMRE